MADLDPVYAAIHSALDDLAPTLPEGTSLSKEPDTVLFGRGGALDSLALVNLVVSVEQLIEDRLGVAVTLADERAMSQKHSPFRTIRSLAEYVGGLIEEQRNPPDVSNTPNVTKA